MTTPADAPLPRSPNRRWGPLAKLTLLTAVLGSLGLGFQLQYQIRTDLKRDLVWYRYGAPPSLHNQAERWFPLTYPLLAHWSQSEDPARSGYALQVLLRHGQPYTSAWLEERLKHNRSGSDFSQAIRDPLTGKTFEDWQQLFGLDQPAPRQRLIQLAIANLKDQPTWQQFNADFLNTLTSEGLGNRVWPQLLAAAQSAPPARARVLLELFPYDFEGLPSNLAQQVRALRANLPPDPDQSNTWDAIEQFRSLTNPTPQSVLAFYQTLSLAQQQLLLSQMPTTATGLSPSARLLLDQVVRAENSPNRILAAAVLLSQNDPRGREILAGVVDGDLQALNSVQSDYLLLLQVAQAFPDSRFSRACREYAAIRGGTYFGDYRPTVGDDWHEVQRRLPAASEAARWRGWLADYPDHPGADDAGYWLGRSLEWQGQRVEALQQFANLLATPTGDGDMQSAIRDRFLLLLDVGTTAQELDQFLKANAQHPLAPVVRYALALHLARSHAYDQALALSEGLALADLSQQYLGAGSLGESGQNASEIQTAFEAQRQRWRHLSQWLPLDTPQKRYALASAWAAEDGWKNGYLVFYNGSRTAQLAFGIYSNDARDNTEIADGYRRANANVVALALLWPLLTGPNPPAELVEKSRYLQVALLYRQFISYPPPETEAMHPLPQFAAGVGADASLYTPAADPYAPPPSDPYYLAYRANREREAWYVRQAIDATHQLLAQFPQSRFGDDALLSLYEMSGDARFLDQLLARFPQGDRAEEARAARFVARHAPDGQPWPLP